MSGTGLMVFVKRITICVGFSLGFPLSACLKNIKVLILDNYWSFYESTPLCNKMVYFKLK